MKQINAFIHPHRMPAVTEALRNCGLCDVSAGTGCYHVTAATVQRLYTSTSVANQHYSLELAEPVVAESKLELICEDNLVDPLTQVIMQAARPGAGWLYVSEIHNSMKIG